MKNWVNDSDQWKMIRANIEAEARVTLHTPLS
jgi:hypothetical protein